MLKILVVKSILHSLSRVWFIEIIRLFGRQDTNKFCLRSSLEQFSGSFERKTAIVVDVDFVHGVHNFVIRVVRLLWNLHFYQRCFVSDNPWTQPTFFSISWDKREFWGINRRRFSSFCDLYLYILVWLFILFEKSVDILSSCSFLSTCKCCFETILNWLMKQIFSYLCLGWNCSSLNFTFGR